MSVVLPKGMLEAQRVVYGTSLTRTCTVSTPGASSVDDYGNTSNTPSTVSGVKCSFMERAAYENMIGGALTASGDVVMFFEAGASLSPSATVSAAADTAFNEPAVTFQLVGMIGGPPRNTGQVWTATRG